MASPEIRLAFRVEGNMWNCYAADMGTMDGAVWIGSIAMAAVDCDGGEETKQQFMGLMTQTVKNWARTIGAQIAEMTVTPAPDHERAGNG